MFLQDEDPDAAVVLDDSSSDAESMPEAEVSETTSESSAVDDIE